MARPSSLPRAAYAYAGWALGRDSEGGWSETRREPRPSIPYPYPSPEAEARRLVGHRHSHRLV
jgi:hypothetical protein